MNSDAFKDRLRSAMDGTSNRAFAEKCDISEGTLRSYLKGETFPPLDTLEVIAAKANVRLAWLAAGEGEMRRGTNVREGAVTYSAENSLGMNVYSLAGAGNPNELTDTEPVAQIVIPRDFYRASVVPVMIRGRSMEDTIMDGAVVGIDREDKWVISGEVYAIWIPHEGAVVKRLFLDTEKITCKSDNPKFADFIVPLNKVDEHFIQGRVRWVIQQY